MRLRCCPIPGTRCGRSRPPGSALPAAASAAGRRVTFPRVSPRDLLTQLSAGRIALGAALVARPEGATSMWVGGDGGRPRGRVLARGPGARDMALGAGTLAAERGGQSTTPWVLGGLLCDATDLLATHAARDRLPRAATPLIYALAGGALLAGLANLADSTPPQA